MAKPPSSSLLVFVVAMVALQPAQARDSQLPGSRMRRHQFQVFFKDQLNVTDVLVAQAKAGPITTVGAPFGTLFCQSDQITAGQEPNSTVLGSLSGLVVMSSLDGLTFINYLTLAIDTRKPHPHTPTHLRGFHGTLNMFGLLNVVNPQPSAIVGGTGSFLFAQGSATVIPIDVRSIKQQLFRVDIDLYLPA